MLSKRLKRVAVLGAAGKMGRGIALLLLQNMARAEAYEYGTVGSGVYRLMLIDTDQQRIDALAHDFKPILTKYAMQHISALRTCFARRSELVENEQMIREFVDGALAMMDRSTALESARGSLLVFEAIAEDVGIKVAVYQQLDRVLGEQAFYLTNTSSIPISQLDKEAHLSGRIIGFHFYNPPTVQRLVELIPCAEGRPELFKLSQEIGKWLGKTFIVSNDKPGFIGNGHFMREVVYACSKVQTLSKTMPLERAIFYLNSITQNLLLRPMGIFQLIDFVGIDVCLNILAVMHCQAPLLQKFLDRGVRGGQASDGSQLPGIFTYADGVPVGIYVLDLGKYEPLETAAWMPSAVKDLTAVGYRLDPWHRLWKDPQRKAKVDAYLRNLSTDSNPAAIEAREYLAQSRKIAQDLVAEGVAIKASDVNAVLELGFSHLYGPLEVK